ncbi:MAG: zf-HC2 domain-containing protein [Burkholderiales bacterium]|nr:zf-HC2 domain-containing protein [Burkholderiales bacterium]
MLNCKEATRLASKALDEELTLAERTNFAFHLMMCSGCRNFRQNILFLRQASEHAKPVPPEDTSDAG